MTIKGNLGDLILVPFLAYLGFTGNAWFFVPAIILFISLFYETGWSRKDGFFMRRYP